MPAIVFKTVDKGKTQMRCFPELLVVLRTMSYSLTIFQTPFLMFQQNMMPIVGTNSVAHVMRQLHGSSRGSSVRPATNCTVSGVRTSEMRHTRTLET